MTTEFLKGLGLEQGVIDSIMSEKGKEVSALQAKYGDYDDVKKQLADANKQISAFKDMDIDGIKKAADDWKTKAETAEADANKKIAEMQFGYALEAALSAAKAKNPKAVKALLNMDGLKQNGEEIVGLKEQLEKLKESDAYLFEAEQAQGRAAASAQGAGVTTAKTDQANAALRAAFGRN